MNKLLLWKNIYRGFDKFSDKKTLIIFQSLWLKLQEYNMLFDTHFDYFETTRCIERQILLLKNGKSQVAHADLAPHVKGRAIDIAELVNGVWKWDNDKLRLLHDWLEENFIYFDMLRTGGNFKNFSDLPHYEILKTVWIGYNYDF